MTKQAPYGADWELRIGTYVTPPVYPPQLFAHPPRTRECSYCLSSYPCDQERCRTCGAPNPVQPGNG